ncbi:hypothetical protein XEUVH32_19190, partial [Xanthomonas euvesicatoria]
TLASIHADPLPDSVASSFNCHLRILSGTEAFVDRVFALNETTNVVIAWRHANIITGQQTADCLRRLRRICQEDLGAIVSNEVTPAIELEENRIKPKRKGQSKADAAKVAAMLRPRPN